MARGLVTLDTAHRPERLASLRLWVLGPRTENLDDLRKKWLRWLDDKAGRVAFDVTEPVVAPDDSVNNLSSIMLLAEAAGRSILLTGDGRSQDIIAGLEAVGKLPVGGTCHVDVMKVPHHGSARNVVGELFDRVQADLYVFSADGKYGNPDWQTLVWLVEAAQRQGRSIHMIATNWTDSLRRLEKQYPPETNHYRLTVMPSDQTSFVV
jgi:beta-lactamase superfamily II metal-dependent hydrolase